MAGTSKTSTTLNVRIPNEILARLQAEAETRDISVGSLIVGLLRRAYGSAPPRAQSRSKAAAG